MTNEAAPTSGGLEQEDRGALRDTSGASGEEAQSGAANPTIRVAGMLIVEGRILMVQQGRGEERYWLLPGGGVRFGETLADALRRELQEELGLRVGVGRLLAIVESISPDPAYHKHVVHLVFEISASPEALPEPKEDTVLGTAYLDELELARGDIRPPIAEFLTACVRELPSSPQYLGRRW